MILFVIIFDIEFINVINYKINFKFAMNDY